MREARIFLTGGTGILGTELIPRLMLGFPGARITALVRARDAATAQRRRAHLDRYLSRYHRSVDLSRLELLAGDVTFPRLGIGPETLVGLHRTVTHVVHAAATTRLSVPESCARAVNVEGTREVLEFASQCAHLARFAHVSTAFVSGRRTGRVLETEFRAPDGFLNAYEASKFQAESLVRGAMSALPITVFRPGILMGDARDGHIVSQATLYLPLREILRGTLRRIPGNPQATLDLLPVDVAAEALVGLLRRDSASGRTYHLTAGPRNRITIRDFLTMAMARCGAGPGPGLRFLPPGTHGRSGASGPQNPFQPFFDYLEGDRVFDDAALRRDLGPDLPRRPHPRQWLGAMLQFCHDTQWGARIPWEDAPCAA